MKTIDGSNSSRQDNDNGTVIYDVEDNNNIEDNIIGNKNSSNNNSWRCQPNTPERDYVYKRTVCISRAYR